MKKTFKIVSVILLVFVITIGCLAAWQRNNIASIITSTKYTKEELTQKIDNNKKEVDEIVEKFTGTRIRNFNHEEEEKIRRGEITAEMAYEKIVSEFISVGNKDFDLSNLQTTSDHTKNTEIAATNPVKDSKTIVNEHVAQMYKLKAQYIGKLGDLERRAIADYNSLPKEKKGASGQQSIVSKYIGEAAALESECDGKINEILASLQKEIKTFGGDLELIKTIRKAYDEEKLLKKSYYINSYR